MLSSKFNSYSESSVVIFYCRAIGYHNTFQSPWNGQNKKLHVVEIYELFSITSHSWPRFAGLNSLWYIFLIMKPHTILMRFKSIFLLAMAKNYIIVDFLHVERYNYQENFFFDGKITGNFCRFYLLFIPQLKAVQVDSVTTLWNKPLAQKNKGWLTVHDQQEWEHDYCGELKTSC